MEELSKCIEIYIIYEETEESEKIKMETRTLDKGRRYSAEQVLNALCHAIAAYFHKTKATLQFPPTELAKYAEMKILTRILARGVKRHEL